MQSHEELAVVVWPSYTHSWQYALSHVTQKACLCCCCCCCNNTSPATSVLLGYPCFSSLLFSCLCMKNSSLGTSFPTSLIQQVRYAHHDLPTVWRIKLTRLAFPPFPPNLSHEEEASMQISWLVFWACLLPCVWRKEGDARDSYPK
jgi:hypothetical protein